MMQVEQLNVIPLIHRPCSYYYYLSLRLKIIKSTP